VDVKIYINKDEHNIKKHEINGKNKKLKNESNNDFSN
jgi:hypothetical protein